MRTAITDAITHRGECVLLHGRTTPIAKHLEYFRSLEMIWATKGRKHPDFAEVRYQECEDDVTGGMAKTLRFSPEIKESKPMKPNRLKELAVAALVAFCLTTFAFHAQAGLTTWQLLGGTNNLSAGVTNSQTAQGSFFTGNTTDATLQFAAIGNGATGTNGSTVTFRMDMSVDNANWQTWVPFTLTVNTNGTPTTVTNLPAGFRPPFIRVNAVENPGQAITNLSIKIFTKDGF